MCANIIWEGGMMCAVCYYMPLANMLDFPLQSVWLSVCHRDKRKFGFRVRESAHSLHVDVDMLYVCTNDYGFGSGLHQYTRCSMRLWYIRGMNESIFVVVLLIRHASTGDDLRIICDAYNGNIIACPFPMAAVYIWLFIRF